MEQLTTAEVGVLRIEMIQICSFSICSCYSRMRVLQSIHPIHCIKENPRLKKFPQLHTATFLNHTSIS